MAGLVHSTSQLAIATALGIFFAACGTGTSSSGFSGAAAGTGGTATGGTHDSGAGGVAGTNTGGGSGGMSSGGGSSGGSAGGCHTAAECPMGNASNGTFGVAQCLAPGQATPPVGCGAVGWCGQCSCGPQPQLPLGNGMSCTQSIDCPAASPKASTASLCDMGVCTQCITSADCPATAPACGMVRSNITQLFRMCLECQVDSDCPATSAHCSLSGGLGHCVTCASDKDCQFGICSSGGCVPGCSAQSPCPSPLTRCGATQRCEALPCDNDAACPHNAVCKQGACARRSCAQDRDCDTGGCVNGLCYETLGTCYTQMFAP
ncbi:MAG TPA: hypothetical protein VHB79_02175 [Polyangiaceae bacterium]|nr:hypothetical protein [Polyangiaceae bacterium]